MTIFETRMEEPSEDTDSNPLEQSQRVAARTLTEFIHLLQEPLIDSVKNITENNISITYFQNGDGPYVYNGQKNITNTKFAHYRTNGYYIIQKFYTEIEKELKLRFPTLLINHTQETNRESLTFINYIDPKPIVKFAGLNL
ncbi:7048_t:CDS:2 [Acaulospora morrowiae]|uniref:7048_t:CDS:1 n=1 Tax=Acaulospora morrowiae TaxID=94023 RepID=A0A9N9FEE9_9GLOM|nr:7048_t:CDS:2 [Acaulospora morrowiae]